MGTMTEPPIGPEVDTTPRPLPARIPHRGSAVDLEPLAVRHAEDLWQAAQADAAGHSWAYMGYGPFADAAAIRRHVAGFSGGDIAAVSLCSMVQRSFRATRALYQFIRTEIATDRPR